MKLKLISSLILVLATMGCRKVSFAPSGVSDPIKLVEPGTAVTPPGGDSPVLKAGACVDQQAVASCLKCDNPAPVVAPVISTKAQKLGNIMKMSCQIYNKSYPSDYVAPSNSEIESRLLACTAELYPETPMTAAQTSTMNRLLDPNDDSMRKKLFKGLWYQPPYTDHFEYYFGLEGKEAAAAFCLGEPISGQLITAEYAQAVSGDNFSQWQNDPAAQARWNQAQSLRRQLLSCLNKPGTAVPGPTPLPAPKNCEFKSFEGNFADGGRDQMFRLLTDGYKLAVETSNSCDQWTQVPEAGKFAGRVKIVGFRCR